MKEKKILKEKTISLKIESEFVDLLKKVAEQEERSLSNLIRKAVKEYLRKRDLI